MIFVDTHVFMYAVVPVQRMQTLEAAMQLVEGPTDDIWPVEADDVRLAHVLIDTHPALGAAMPNS